MEIRAKISKRERENPYENLSLTLHLYQLMYAGKEAGAGELKYSRDGTVKLSLLSIMNKVSAMFYIL
jgi:hypothetical protein